MNKQLDSELDNELDSKKRDKYGLITIVSIALVKMVQKAGQKQAAKGWKI